MPGRTLKLGTFLLGTLALLGLPAYAGAWTPEQGRTYLKFSSNLFKSSANYTVNGDSFDPFAGFEDRYSKFRDENLLLYFETGLTDRLALQGNILYKDIEQRTVNASLDLGLGNSGFADVELGLRYRLNKGGPNVFSVGFLVKLPYLYDDDDSFFQLGNGQEDYELRFLYGRSLGQGFYGGFEAGYRLRSGEPSDEYRYLGEFGWSFQSFYTRAKLEGINATESFEDSGSNFGNPILNPRYDLTTGRLTAGYSINKSWHVEYTYSETLEGKNTADGTNTELGVVFTF